MCGRTRPIKKYVPPDNVNIGRMTNKEKLLVPCKRCGLPYGRHYVELEKAVLVRSCDDNAPDI